MVTWSCRILGCANQLIVQSSQPWAKMNPWAMTTWRSQWMSTVHSLKLQMVEGGEVNMNNFSTGRWTEENWYVCFIVNILSYRSSHWSCIILLLSWYRFYTLVGKKTSVCMLDVSVAAFLTTNVYWYSGILNCWNPRLYCSRSSAKERIWNGMRLVQHVQTPFVLFTL